MYISNQTVTYCMRRDVFQAIADPTRRDIIGLLTHNTLNVSEIAEKFPISRPAISKQIKVLEECGLVRIEQKGRERYCTVNLTPLTEVVDWVEQYRKVWEQRLDSFESYIQTLTQNQPENENTDRNL